jgi:cyclase
MVMKRVRVIPVLLLKDRGLVKTARFRNPTYVGDPINAVKIFNQKEVDEIAVIDISDRAQDEGPDVVRFADIASEAFMPMACGGGVRSESQAERLFAAGAEKVVLNTAAFRNPDLVSTLASRFGSQSVIVSLDVKSDWLRRTRVFTNHGRVSSGLDPVTAAKQAERMGAGEILLHAIDREGTYTGFDLDLIQQVVAAVGVPVIALGGARHLADLGSAVRIGGASAVAAGSMFVFNGPHRAVLISYPSPAVLQSEVFLPSCKQAQSHL